MANNRMFIRCKTCKKMTLLGKFYPGTSWYLDFGLLKQGHANCWLTRHSNCDPHASINSGPDHFELIFESSPSFDFSEAEDKDTYIHDSDCPSLQEPFDEDQKGRSL